MLNPMRSIAARDLHCAAFLIVWITLLSAAPVLHAQERDTVKTPAPPAPSTPQEPALNFDTPETVRILGISVQGLTTIAEKDVLARLGLPVDKEIQIPGVDITNAIKRLWRQKLFSDIKIEVERRTLDGVFLAVKVAEYPVLSDMLFEGNRDLSTEDLRSKSGLIRGTTATEQSLEAAKQRLLKYYQDEGFLLADITYELRETTGGRAAAYFFIRENVRVFIEKVVFNGNKSFDNGYLEGIFEETKATNFWRNIFGKPKLDRQKFETDKEKLASHYRENGFRDMRVLSDSITYSADKTKLYVNVYLNEGPKYVIRNIEWEGNALFPDAGLASQFGIKKGDVYNQKKLQERLNSPQEEGNIGSLYLDDGYLSFRADMDETVVQGDSVDLKIYITEGNQFRIRNVNIKGNSKTKDHVIRRELFYTLPGDLFSRDKLIRSIRQLSALNYFDAEKINPDVQPVAKDGKDEVDLTYQLVEKQTDSFNASAGYSGSVGFTGAFGVTFKNFSIQDVLKGEAWDPLPHGDGQTLDLNWQFGAATAFRTISITFSEPWAFGTPTSLGVSLYDTFQNFGQAIQQTGVSISIGRRLSFPDDYFRIDWVVRLQRNVGGFLNILQQSSLPNNTADEVSVAQTISRNSIDNPIYPRRGSDISFTAQLSGGILPGSVDYYKFQFSNAWYRQVAKDLVITLNTRLGHIGKFSSSDFVPFNSLFYMGGSGLSPLPTIQLRGYPDQSVGVYDAAIGRSTGNTFVKFGSELRYPITLNPSASVYVLAFAEAGNLWLRPGQVNLADLKRSAGFGVRVLLPILGAPIGLDYGYGFDGVTNPNTGRIGAPQGWNFIFTFGAFAQ